MSTSDAGRDAWRIDDDPSRSAAQRLEDYLNDTVAPLQAAEAVLDFLRRDPAAASRIILQWADHQLDVNLHAIPVSDLLYHALKKIQIFEELGLAESMRGLVASTAARVRAYCPADELPDFDVNMNRLHESSKLFRTVELLHRIGDELDPEAAGKGDPKPDEEDLDALRKRAAERQAAARGAAVKPAAQEPQLSTPDRQAARLLAARRLRHPDLDSIRQDQVALGLKRFSMLVDTLEKAKERQQSETWVPHLLSSAALGSRNYEEFRGYLHRLKQLGLEDLHMEQVFRSVAESMPDWHLTGEAQPQPESAATVVMERIVDFAEQDAEKAERLAQIVATAVEHFNRGRLGSALTLLELADRLLGSSGLAPFERAKVRSSARPELRMDPFRRLLARPERHADLRVVLEFFPDLRVEALIRRLLREEKARSRRLIMELLSIHGRPAREAAAEILISSTAISGREWPWYFVRNLIRILRDIPAAADSISHFELETVIRYADPGRALQVVREAIAYLGTVSHPQAVEALIRRFQGYCAALREAGEDPGSDLAKVQAIALSYLLRSGDPLARAAALDELLAGPGGRWQVTRGRVLRVLGDTDLANDRDSLDRLLRAVRLRLRGPGLSRPIAALRQRLPEGRLKAMLGGVGPTREAALEALIQALGGTPVPEVAQLLAAIEEARPTERLAQLAADTRGRLEELSLEVEADSPPTLAGDLEVFGLPNIIQSLQRGEASGTLTVEAKEVERAAVIRILNGRFVDAKVGGLRGVEAFYLLFERPLSSTFRFVSDTTRQVAKRPQELKALLFEGMRRRDEYERMRLLLPDDAVLALAGAEPSVPASERGAAFVNRLWQTVAKGAATPAGCEARDIADPYRVRKVLLHWIDAGRVRLAGAVST